MFGHQNDVITQDQKSDAEVKLPDSALSALTSAPVTTPPTNSPTQPASPPAVTTPDNSSAAAPDEGITLDESVSTPDTHHDQPAETAPQSKPTAANIRTDDLLDIKHDALQDLSPLIDKLDLPPEEKFKTIMMLIQASDDQSLIPQAYDLAKKIKDEKAKAQALLDVVNEINYFTQKDTQN